jgi:putative ABC transport system substrate-binding protein
MAYGANRADLHRQLAVYVDRILKGAKPSDLPLVDPARFDLTINLRTAGALGLDVPSSVRARADHLIGP